MEVYLVCTFGKTGVEYETDEMGREAPVQQYGTILVSTWDTLDAAQADAEGRFQAEPDVLNSPWIKSAMVWAPSRDPARRDRLYLWSALPSAAPSMDDPNRDFYPQMRETSWNIRTLAVNTDAS